MIILWSAVFVLVATAQIRVQGAPNPLNPNSITRINRAIKCAQLVSVDGGFIMLPGGGGAYPIPGNKGVLLIPGCLEIFHGLKEGKIVKSFEDLGPADPGLAKLGPADLRPADLGDQTKDGNQGAGRKYEIVDLNKP